jgi:predicted dehydrogenase
MPGKLDVALIGASGYWAQKILPNLKDLPGVRLKALTSHGTPPAGMRHLAPGPETELTRDVDAVLSRGDIDAVVVATPAGTHHDVAMRAIRARKHVFLEKPPALTHREVLSLASAAERRNLVVMVDHIFRFSKHMRRMESLIAGGAIGRPLHFQSRRANFGLFRTDSDALSDLGYHDVYLIQWLLSGERPLRVTAFASCHFKPGHADVCGFSVRFAGGAAADVVLSWLSPTKDRRIIVAGTKGIIEFRDDRDLLLHARSARLVKGRFRTTDRGTRRIAVRGKTNPLRDALEHFVLCVRRGENPLCALRDGAEAVRWQEKIRRSVREGRAIRF